MLSWGFSDGDNIVACDDFLKMTGLGGYKALSDLHPSNGAIFNYYKLNWGCFFVHEISHMYGTLGMGPLAMLVIIADAEAQITRTLATGSTRLLRFNNKRAETNSQPRMRIRSACSLWRYRGFQIRLLRCLSGRTALDDRIEHCRLQHSRGLQ